MCRGPTNSREFRVTSLGRRCSVVCELNDLNRQNLRQRDERRRVKSLHLVKEGGTEMEGDRKRRSTTPVHRLERIRSEMIPRCETKDASHQGQTEGMHGWKCAQCVEEKHPSLYTGPATCITTVIPCFFSPAAHHRPSSPSHISRPWPSCPVPPVRRCAPSAPADDHRSVPWSLTRTVPGARSGEPASPWKPGESKQRCWYTRSAKRGSATLQQRPRPHRCICIRTNTHTALSGSRTTHAMEHGRH